MESIGIIGGIIGIVALIVFFVMNDRLGKIAGNTSPKSYNTRLKQYYEARANEVAGNKAEALKNYYVVLWRYNPTFAKFSKVSKESLETKIKELGGDPSIKPKLN